MKMRMGMAIALAAAATAGTAVSATAATAPVAGTQTIVGGQDTPDATDDVYRMSGGLVGEWTTTRFDVLGIDEASGRLVGVGSERFVGCLDRNRDGACTSADVRGSLTFGFVFWGQFDLTTFAELSGQCVHPTIAGTGGFAGATGVIRFVDAPGTGTAAYRGRLDLRRPAKASPKSANEARRAPRVRVCG